MARPRIHRTLPTLKINSFFVGIQRYIEWKEKKGMDLKWSPSFCLPIVSVCFLCYQLNGLLIVFDHSENERCCFDVKSDYNS